MKSPKLLISLILVILLSFSISCGGSSGSSSDEVTLPDYRTRPIVFVHGFMGSTSQFESQAQRFIANGYDPAWIKVFEHDTTNNEPLTILNQVVALDAFIT